LDQNGKSPEAIGEPLFELPLSGLYWQITRLDTKEPKVHSSHSLWDGSLPRLPDDKLGYVVGPENQKLRLVEHTIDLGDDGRYLISVAGDSSEITNPITAFNGALLIVFGSLSFIFVSITLILVARTRSDAGLQNVNCEGFSAGARVA
jgi:hypothetical protein